MRIPIYSVVKNLSELTRVVGIILPIINSDININDRRRSRRRKKKTNKIGTTVTTDIKSWHSKIKRRIDNKEMIATC